MDVWQSVGLYCARFCCSIILFILSVSCFLILHMNPLLSYHKSGCIRGAITTYNFGQEGMRGDSIVPKNVVGYVSDQMEGGAGYELVVRIITGGELHLR